MESLHILLKFAYPDYYPYIWTMDAFQTNAFNIQIDGGSTVEQALACMGYLKDKLGYVKRIGFIQIVAHIKDGEWELVSFFQSHNNTIQCWNSDKIENEKGSLKDLCVEIGFIENSLFHVITSGKVIGLHFDEMPKDYKRNTLINSIVG